MGSVVDTLTTGSRAAALPTAPKRSAVAHEVRVDVTGAKPSFDAGKRELFAESTTSVLVFENGGVIRLAADVAPGQLLFLSQTATKHEVVAQVTRKHALGSGYVEVEFTEPAPEFWGVDLPSQPEAVQTRRAESAPAAALREAVEKADQETPAAPDMPSAAEVERLKSEIEALRGQLESIQQQPADQAEVAPPTPPWVAKKAKAETLEAVELESGLAKGNENAASNEPAEAEPGFAAQDLLPKAALDFSRADAVNALAPKARATARGGSNKDKLRLALLAALLLAMLGAAWYQGWIPGLRSAKPQPRAASPTRPAASRTAAVSAAQKLGTEPGALTGPAVNRSDAAYRAQPAETAPPRGAPAETATAEKNSETEAGPEASRPAPEEGLAAPDARAAGHPSRVATAAEKASKKKVGTDDDLSPALEDDQDLVAPKLVHSVRAVPPPEAVRQFATGNVILDAVVDATGRVKSSRVLSGPPSLRNAAVDALKQYNYMPAKRHGKAVPAHVQVTVQFWYEP